MFYIKEGGIKMEIGQFSIKTGLAVDTLRYYDKIGLLVPNKKNGRRYYSEEDLEKAIIIMKFKRLNFTLEEINSLFNLDDEFSDDDKLNEEDIDRVNSCIAMLREKYDDIVKKEQDIVQIKDTLEKMIGRINKLLQVGYFFDDMEEEQGSSKKGESGDNMYKDTINFWNDIFNKYEAKKVTEPMDFHEDIAYGISWICREKQCLLDYGCGSGSMLLKAMMDYGISKGVGIDISDKAIELAKDTAILNNLDNKLQFKCGAMESLEELKDNSFQGAILSNIIDNVTPEDMINIIKNIKRVVVPNGRIMIKVNPYIEEEYIREYEMRLIGEDFYVEKEGIYLRNLTTSQWHEILETSFAVNEYKKVNYEEFNQYNRMFLLTNNK